MTRTFRSALLALLVTAVSLVGAAALAAPAQAATGNGDRVATGAALPRQAIDRAKISKAVKLPAAAKRVGAVTTGAAARAPLPGFCTFDRYDGVTSYLGCSVVIPATVYVLCSNGNIFYGYLPYPGIYSLTATPCYATGYALV
ncbi:hypothetical protein AB0M02_24685 [Actinoplanes sp. NPDC051861]|uniref:hypothetical protein n=1 Tax=Actinoplanes sp. NPDC051861 TaxID=3155170 RepID=UPI00343E40ED